MAARFGGETAIGCGISTLCFSSHRGTSSMEGVAHRDCLFFRHREKRSLEFLASGCTLQYLSSCLPREAQVCTVLVSPDRHTNRQPYQVPGTRYGVQCSVYQDSVAFCLPVMMAMMAMMARMAMMVMMVMMVVGTLPSPSSAPYQYGVLHS